MFNIEKKGIISYQFIKNGLSVTLIDTTDESDLKKREDCY